MSELELIVNLEKVKDVKPEEILSLRGVQAFRFETIRPFDLELTHFRAEENAAKITLTLGEVTAGTLRQIADLYETIAFWVND